VLADILQRDTEGLPATGQIRQAQDWAGGRITLAAMLRAADGDACRRGYWVWSNLKARWPTSPSTTSAS
jgi:hypothetical protein